MFKKVVVTVFILLFCASAQAYNISSIGLLSGYLQADLKEKADYELIPIMVSFGFDIREAASKIGINTKGILEFQIEPFLNPVLSPDSNLELGVNFLVKYGFPLSENLIPYIKFGAGPAYITQHTREQSTQFNFVDSAGAGFSWYLNKEISIDLEYRYRHLSNASVDKPNNGIDANTFLVGFSRHF